MYNLIVLHQNIVRFNTNNIPNQTLMVFTFFHRATEIIIQESTYTYIYTILNYNIGIDV